MQPMFPAENHVIVKKSHSEDEMDEIRLVEFVPNSHRKLVLLSLFVNLHFGIPALVFSILCQIDYGKGEMRESRRKGKLAYKLAVAGLCMTLFFLLNFILLHVFVFPITLYPKIFNS